MKGIYSALLVSFDKEGNINEKGLRQIVRHNIDVNKVDGLYVGGDGAGLTRGLAQAGANGIVIARHIISR